MNIKKTRKLVNGVSITLLEKRQNPQDTFIQDQQVFYDSVEERLTTYVDEYFANLELPTQATEQVVVDEDTGEEQVIQIQPATPLTQQSFFDIIATPPTDGYVLSYNAVTDSLYWSQPIDLSFIDQETGNEIDIIDYQPQIDTINYNIDIIYSLIDRNEINIAQAFSLISDFSLEVRTERVKARYVQVPFSNNPDSYGTDGFFFQQLNDDPSDALSIKFGVDNPAYGMVGYSFGEVDNYSVRFSIPAYALAKRGFVWTDASATSPLGFMSVNTDGVLSIKSAITFVENEPTIFTSGTVDASKDGYAMVYDSGTSAVTLSFVSASGGGATQLQDLSDVNLTSEVAGDFLIYDGAQYVNLPSGNTLDVWLTGNQHAVLQSERDMYVNTDHYENGIIYFSDGVLSYGAGFGFHTGESRFNLTHTIDIGGQILSGETDVVQIMNTEITGKTHNIFYSNAIISPSIRGGFIYHDYDGNNPQSYAFFHNGSSPTGAYLKFITATTNFEMSHDLDVDARILSGGTDITTLWGGEHSGTRTVNHFTDGTPTTGNTIDWGPTWSFQPNDWNDEPWTFVRPEDGETYRSGIFDFSCVWDDDYNEYHIIGIRMISSATSNQGLHYSAWTDFIHAKSPNLSGNSFSMASGKTFEDTGVPGVINTICGLEVEGEQIDMVWAPHVFKYDGAWYMFYTGCEWGAGDDGYNGAQTKQRIFVAKTYDINDWSTPELKFCFDGDTYWSTYSSTTNYTFHCRDPYVQWDEDYDRWLMFVSVQVDAAYADTGSTSNAIGLASATTLMGEWTLYDWIRETEGGPAESASVIKGPDDVWYLQYSFDNDAFPQWADSLRILSSTTLSDVHGYGVVPGMDRTGDVAAELIPNPVIENTWTLGFVDPYTLWAELRFDNALTFTGGSLDICYTGHPAIDVPYSVSSYTQTNVNFTDQLFGHMNEDFIHYEQHQIALDPKQIIGGPDYLDAGYFGVSGTNDVFAFHNHMFMDQVTPTLPTAIYWRQTGTTKWATIVEEDTGDFKIHNVASPSTSKIRLHNRNVQIDQHLEVLNSITASTITANTIVSNGDIYVNQNGGGNDAQVFYNDGTVPTGASINYVFGDSQFTISHNTNFGGNYIATDGDSGGYDLYLNTGAENTTRIWFGNSDGAYNTHSLSYDTTNNYFDFSHALYTPTFYANDIVVDNGSPTGQYEIGGSPQYGFVVKTESNVGGWARGFKFMTGSTVNGGLFGYGTTGVTMARMTLGTDYAGKGLSITTDPSSPFSGFVGINDLTPAYHLDVNGDIRATGQIFSGAVDLITLMGIVSSGLTTDDVENVITGVTHNVFYSNLVKSSSIRGGNIYHDYDGNAPQSYAYFNNGSVPTGAYLKYTTGTSEFEFSADVFVDADFSADTVTSLGQIFSGGVDIATMMGSGATSSGIQQGEVISADTLYVTGTTTNVFDYDVQLNSDLLIDTGSIISWEGVTGYYGWNATFNRHEFYGSGGIYSDDDIRCAGGTSGLFRFGFSSAALSQIGSTNDVQSAFGFAATTALSAGTQIYSGGTDIGTLWNKKQQFTKIFYAKPPSTDTYPMFSVPFDCTIIRVSYKTDTGTTIFNLQERSESTPDTVGTNVWSSNETASSTSSASTNFNNSTLDAYDWLCYSGSSLSGSPTELWIAVTFEET